MNEPACRRRNNEVSCATVRILLERAATVLAGAGSEGAWNEAAWLLAHVLGFSRAELVLAFNDHVGERVSSRFLGMIGDRAEGKPLDYIIGYSAFRFSKLRVTADVLIPRPETEDLVDMLLQDPDLEGEGRFLDVGTGSGAIAISIAQASPGWQGVAVDASNAALELARENAQANGVGHQLSFRQSNFMRSIGGAAFDIIVSNPPYVPSGMIDNLEQSVSYEPRLALDGGVDGLGPMRSVIDEAPTLLAAGGLLALEVGVGQSESVAGIIERDGRYGKPWVRVDSRQVPRFVFALRGFERIA